MKVKFALAVGGATFLAGSVLANGGTLYEQNMDGSNYVNGYSTGTTGGLGLDRRLLDDFRVTDSAGWTIADFHFQHVWGSGTATPQGTGMNIWIRSDAGGAPGGVMHTLNITGYSESALGRLEFSRNVMESWVDFDPVDLAAGTYWFEAQITGPENNFWLVTDGTNGNGGVFGAEAWVNYVSEAGLQSGTAQFGAARDLNFRLTGSVIPAPGAVALLGLAGLAARRRRR